MFWLSKEFYCIKSDASRRLMGRLFLIFIVTKHHFDHDLDSHRRRRDHPSGDRR